MPRNESTDSPISHRINMVYSLSYTDADKTTTVRCELPLVITHEN